MEWKFALCLQTRKDPSYGKREACYRKGRCSEQCPEPAPVVPDYLKADPSIPATGGLLCFPGSSYGAFPRSHRVRS